MRDSQKRYRARSSKSARTRAKPRGWSEDGSFYHAEKGSRSHTRRHAWLCSDDLKHYPGRVSNDSSGGNGRTRKRVSGSSTVDAANVNMTTREGRDSVTDAYQNRCPKGKTILPGPGVIAIFNLSPWAGGRKSCQVGPSAPISFRLSLYNGCLEHPSQYSPVRSALRGFLPPPGVSARCSELRSVANETIVNCNCSRFLPFPMEPNWACLAFDPESKADRCA